MPAGFSGLRMRKEIERARDHPKADFTRRRGDGSESPLKKRKAESVRAKEIVLITGRLENYG